MPKDKEIKKLTILCQDDFLFFEEFEEYDIYEIFGLLEMAKSTIEALYKENFFAKLREEIRNENKND
jgi:hypothetical protein